MTQNNSPMKDRNIAYSVQRLQRAASEGRFRIKSIRLKTLDNQINQKAKTATDKNYEQRLNKLGFSQSFLRELYKIKSEQTKLHISQQKYQAFMRFLYQKLHKTKNLQLNNFNFQKKSSEYFLSQFIKINNNNRYMSTNAFNAQFCPIIAYNFSLCSYLSQNYDDNTKFEDVIQNDIMLKAINNDPNLVKLQLKNMSLNYFQIKIILQLVARMQKFFQLNLSNESSQTMNRLGNGSDIIYQFLKNNKTTSILKLDNLSLKKQGVQHIYKGISQIGRFNPLKILCLKNNGITQTSSLNITMIAKSGLISLDLSQNPLSPNFFLGMSSWKGSTLQILDLSMTNMNSEALIYFLSKLQQNKALQHLKVDNNDFSHHWFNQTKQMLQVNTSIQVLSLVNCNIKRFSDTFRGLHFNRYLKKINISNNFFLEGCKQIGEMLKINKVITEIRMRNCGLNPNNLIQVTSALQQNQTLLFLDIAQNHLGQQAAVKIIKVLNKNTVLLHLGCEKVQIPLRVRKQIQDKIFSNKTIRKQEEMKRLKRQNTKCKQDDLGSWQQVQKLQKMIRINAQNIKISTNRVKNLESESDKKRAKFVQISKQYRNRETDLSQQIQSLKTQINNLQKQQKKTLQHYEKQYKNITSLSLQQQKNIESLQKTIREESLNNMKRQSQLEEQLQNKKYLKKKKQKTVTKQPQVKTGFDTYTGINSKRKSQKF